MVRRIERDVPTDDVSIYRHGHMPKLSGDATKFYNGAGGQTVPPGTGAATGASYVVLSLDSTLTAERVLTAGSGITLTDTGANGTITVAATGAGAGVDLFNHSFIGGI